MTSRTETWRRIDHRYELPETVNRLRGLNPGKQPPNRQLLPGSTVCARASLSHGTARTAHSHAPAMIRPFLILSRTNCAPNWSMVHLIRAGAFIWVRQRPGRSRRRGRLALRSGLRPSLRPSLQTINQFSHMNWYENRGGVTSETRPSASVREYRPIERRCDPRDKKG